MSITKAKNGKWIVRWRELGEHRQKTFPKKFQADDFQANLKTHGRSVRDRINFADFVTNEWQKNYANIERVTSTNMSEAYTIKNHILPAFRYYRLGDITPHLIDQFKVKLVEQDLSPKSVNNILGSLKQILEKAVGWGYLRQNPGKHVKRVPMQKREMAYWSFEDKERFLEFAKRDNPVVYDIVAFAVNTGLRAGEIAGLLRNAIDLERGEIIVKRMFCNKERRLVERTKGKAERRVEMNAVVSEIIQRRANIKPDDPVFPEGSYLCHFGSQWLKPACVRAGVRVLRLHDLRHTFIAHLAMLGVPSIEIQEIAGHKRLTTTEKYMHLDSNRTSGATKLLCDVREMYASERKRNVVGQKNQEQQDVAKRGRSGLDRNRTCFRVLK